MTARPKDNKDETVGMFQPLNEKDEEARKLNKGELGFTGDVISDVVVIKIQPSDEKKGEQSLLYTDASSISIAKDSSTFAGLDLEPELLERYRRKIDRGRLHGEVSFQLPGVKITVKRKPAKEIEEIEHAVWRKPKK
jgi:hypothetical protein